MGGAELCESTLRARITEMDQKGIRGMEEKENGCILNSKPNRYEVVARFLYASHRDKIYSGAVEV